jgi:hypothetical protein
MVFEDIYVAALERDADVFIVTSRAYCYLVSASAAHDVCGARMHVYPTTESCLRLYCMLSTDLGVYHSMLDSDFDFDLALLYFTLTKPPQLAGLSLSGCGRSVHHAALVRPTTDP